VPPRLGVSAATFVPQILQPRYEQLAAAIHNVAPARPVFVQGLASSSTLGLVDKWVTPFADPRVVFAPHYYHPLVHEGGSYDPVDPFTPRALDAMAQMAARLGDVPVWVGEIGGPPGAEGFFDYLRFLVTSIEARGWGWLIWSDDVGHGFGIRDEDGAIRADFAAVLGHPYARRVPGPIEGTELSWPGTEPAGPATARAEIVFRWTVDAPLVAWVGPTGSATLAPAEGEGAEVPCGPAPDAVAGIVRCPPEDTVAASLTFGARYRLTLE